MHLFTELVLYVLKMMHHTWTFNGSHLLSTEPLLKPILAHSEIGRKFSNWNQKELITRIIRKFVFVICISRWLNVSLRWRHNDHAGVSNHQPHGCLLNRLFRRKSKKTSKLRVTGLCAENSPGTGEFPAQMASYAENVSIWWRHHDDGSNPSAVARELLQSCTKPSIWWVDVFASLSLIVLNVINP